MEGFLAEADAEAFALSFRLALATSATLLVVCTPLSLWLVRSHGAFGASVQAVVSLPLVLPPTVLGFYLLLWLAPEGALGRWFVKLGLDAPVFSFEGLWLASLVVSAPFVVQPLHNAFAALGRRPWEAAATLGATPTAAFFRVIMPMTRRAYVSAFVLSFAHTLGEFGVVLMVGGNIRGRTQTVSTSIFGHVEALEYGHAHRLSVLLLALGLAMTVIVQRVGRVETQRAAR